MLKITGLDEAQRKLNDFARRAESLAGTRNVPLPELLTPDFLRRCSKFHSADEMFEASGFKIDSMEDFKAIPDAEWDQFIHTNTSFSTWEAMLREAGGAWAKKQLGF